MFDESDRGRDRCLASVRRAGRLQAGSCQRPYGAVDARGRYGSSPENFSTLAPVTGPIFALSLT
jgi:hypothetical protein